MKCHGIENHSTNIGGITQWAESSTTSSNEGDKDVCFKLNQMCILFCTKSTSDFNLFINFISLKEYDFMALNVRQQLLKADGQGGQHQINSSPTSIMDTSSSKPEEKTSELEKANIKIKYVIT